MSISRERRDTILENLITEIGKNARNNKRFSASGFAQSYNLTRQSVYRYLQKLESESIINKRKDGSKYVYSLVDKEYMFRYPLTGLAEDIVWRDSVSMLLDGFPELVEKNMAYAFTEMLNNAIDHSEGTEVRIKILVNPYRISFFIIDDGVGIFTKIAAALNLAEKRFSILELAKGKFTTAPDYHSGEGIFFSSKAADAFAIISDNLIFTSINTDDFNEDRLHENVLPDWKGTAVYIEIFRDHSTKLSDIMNEYTEYPDGFGFTKTIVPVRLLEYGDTKPIFISRSQAKRLLSGFDRFERIELDFTGIDEIGQGFADEVFRVFEATHHNSKIIAINCNESVDRMIKHVSRR